jgi:hypothetical protein
MYDGLMKSALALLLLVGLHGVTPAQTKAAPDVSSPWVKKVLAWFDGAAGASTHKSGTRKLRGEVLDLIATNHNVVLFLDREFTGAPSSLMAVTWAGEIHAFDLTPAQARASGLAAGGAHLFKSESTENDMRVVPPHFRLDRLEVKGGTTVEGNQEIACSVVCKVTSKPKKGSFTLRRIWTQGSRSTTSFRLLDQMPEDGAIAFTVGPLNKAEGDVHFGPTAVLVDLLMTDPDFGVGFIASNTVGFLVDVKPDLDAFSRLGLKLMDEAVALLASVKDAATAAAALEDFKRFAKRNEAVVEAMERLAPTPEQNAAFEKKYGPKMDDVTRRLGEQVARLEATDYGKAFLDQAETGGKEPR